MKKLSLLAVAALALSVFAPADVGAKTSLCLSLGNLYVGSSDSVLKGQVANLQRFLGDLGYLNAAATGYFGAMTQDAVTRFQRDYGLDQTGYVGPATSAKIEEIGCGASSGASAKPVNGDLATDLSLYGKIKIKVKRDSIIDPGGTAQYVIDLSAGNKKASVGYWILSATCDEGIEVAFKVAGSCGEDTGELSGLASDYGNVDGYSASISNKGNSRASVTITARAYTPSGQLIGSKSKKLRLDAAMIPSYRD
jgi:peptidoglycan hydrolase-like protein with peptidoglycan-binding domain